MALQHKGHPKLTPELIEHIHHWLPVDASTSHIQAMAAATQLSYSTVWHVVRGYCRDGNAPWRAKETDQWQHH